MGSSTSRVDVADGDAPGQEEEGSVGEFERENVNHGGGDGHEDDGADDRNQAVDLLANRLLLGLRHNRYDGARPAAVGTVGTISCPVNVRMSTISIRGRSRLDAEEKMCERKPICPKSDEDSRGVEEEEVRAEGEDVSEEEEMKSAEDPLPFDLCFSFDASSSGEFHILLGAERTITGRSMRERFRVSHASCVESTIRCKYEAGSGQFFSLLAHSSFWSEKLIRDLMVEIGDERQLIPAVIIAEPSASTDLPPITQATVCYFSNSMLEGRNEVDSIDDRFDIDKTEQFVSHRNSVYKMQDIYGLQTKGDDGMDDVECVVCMSEPRDTIILPCLHMCLCNECAEVFRFQTDRCPICRSFVETLLTVDASVNENSDSHLHTGRESPKPLV